MSESIESLSQILEMKDGIIDQLIEKVQVQEQQLKQIFQKLPAQNFHFYSIEGLVYQHFLVKQEGKMYLTLEMDEGDLSGDLLVDCRCKAIRRGCIQEIKKIQRSNQQLGSQFEKLRETISLLVSEQQNPKRETLLKQKKRSPMQAESRLYGSHETQSPEAIIPPLSKINSDQDSMSRSGRKKSTEPNHNTNQIQESFIHNQPTNSEIFRIDETQRIPGLNNNLREKYSYDEDDYEFQVQKPKKPIELSAEPNIQSKKHEQQLILRRRKKLLVRRGYQ